MDVGEIANKFEDLIVSNSMRFRPIIPGEFCEFTQFTVGQFLETHKFKFLIGNTKIEKASVFKIEDSYLQYLDVFPEQMKFMWCTNLHRTGIKPDEALLYLMNRTFPGMKVEIMPDGSIKINDNLRLDVPTRR